MFWFDEGQNQLTLNVCVVFGLESTANALYTALSLGLNPLSSTTALDILNLFWLFCRGIINKR